MSRLRDTDPSKWAKECLEYIGKQRARWGHMWKVETDNRYRPDEVADAAGIIMLELAERAGLTQEEHNKVARQLTAAKAREAKVKKQVGKLKERIDTMAATAQAQQELINMLKKENKGLII